MNTLKRVLVLILLSPLSALAASLTGQVLSVHDGDTLTIQVPAENMKYKVRLLGVDTPEVDFFGHSQGEIAEKARDFVASLAPVGSTITVVFDDNGMDKHGRVLGRILVGDIEINREVLKAGLGYMYFIFPFDKRVSSTYSEDAESAVANHRGLFSPEYQSTLAPYDFRMSVRNQTGNNLIGDLQTKDLFYQEDADKVPVWRRVFFSDKKIAEQNGYHFKL
ncbi:MAG: thermonuclease family protein [Bdellovibrio sp.]|nr:thermonuclease family protein [Bdellovibrio sp.]